MPFSYKISPDEKLAYVTASGPVDLRAALEAMGRIAQEPGFESDFNVVVDAELMEYTPSSGELQVLAWALGHEKRRCGNKVAVVRSPALPERYARLAEVTGVTLSLFADGAAARDWVLSH